MYLSLTTTVHELFVLIQLAWNYINLICLLYSSKKSIPAVTILNLSLVELRVSLLRESLLKQ